MASVIALAVLCIALSSTKGAALGKLFHLDDNDTITDDGIARAQDFPYNDNVLIDFDSEHEIDDYMRVQPYVSPRDLSNPYVNHHQYSYIINHRDKCDGDVFVLALIKTVPENFVERQDVRDTWGSVRSYNGATVVPIFIMGRNKATNGTDKVEQELLKESVKHGDIVQGDFIEHFKNQTYKTVMGLAWAAEYCSMVKFVLITTDSTMVDPYHLIIFLNDRQASGKGENILYCSAFVDIGPVRDPNDKLFVPIYDYPYKVFPPHCEGFAYILSRDVLLKLLEATKSVPFLWLDDVYVTGLLPSKANVPHMDMAEEHSYTWMQEERLNTGIDKSMFLLAPYKELRTNWSKAWSAIVKKNKKRIP